MTLRMVVVCNKEVVFLLQRNGHGLILPLKGFIGFYAQSIMLGQSIFVGFNMTDEDFEPCPYQIQHPWVHQRWLMSLLRLKFWCS